jgi:hypothetical protein
MYSSTVYPTHTYGWRLLMLWIQEDCNLCGLTISKLFGCREWQRARSRSTLTLHQLMKNSDSLKPDPSFLPHRFNFDQLEKFWLANLEWGIQFFCYSGESVATANGATCFYSDEGDGLILHGVNEEFMTLMFVAMPGSSSIFVCLLTNFLQSLSAIIFTTVLFPICNAC